MPIELVKNLLKQKEGIRLEFNEAKEKLPENLFETICAFLNKEGGSILLGVKDNGTCIGVASELIDKFSIEIASLSNNKNKLDPPSILFPSVAEIKGKKIIHVQVPASSQIHKCNGIIYDRSSDGDFKVTDAAKIAELHNRKKAHFTEGIIYQALTKKDFVKELLPKIRNLMRSNKPNHPWLALDDQQLFVTSGLYKKDYQTNREGFTLAAALLLGKEEVIQNILPHYKIDALVKKQNLERYDDRLIIRTNLIDAYDLLMEFIEKHLPDKFYMEGATRISLREKIFREVVANLIVHREYTNAHSASLIIYTDRIEVLNANNPNGSGPISINNFIPFPKNPIISKFFVQLGRVEELGSGIINVERYLNLYSPKSEPMFIEDYIFKTIIPLKITEFVSVAVEDEGEIDDAVNDAVGDAVSDAVKKRLIKELIEIQKKNGMRLPELQKLFLIGRATVQRDMRLLKEGNLVEFIGMPKTGKYVVSSKFHKLISKEK
jgi:ATP-dependent DNA helicase RecG